MSANILMLAAALPAAPSANATWSCTTDRTQVCDQSGCRDEARGATILVSPSSAIYRLCIGDDCLLPKASFFTEDQSILVKFRDDAGYSRIFGDQTFVEVVDIGQKVQISRGRCEIAPPPIIRVPR